MRLAALLLLAIAATHYGEQFFADRPAAFYVLRGIEGAVLFGVIAWAFRSVIPVVWVSLFGMVEEAQTAACGWAETAESHPVGMCMALVGPWPYAAAGAACIVYLIRGKK